VMSESLWGMARRLFWVGFPGDPVDWLSELSHFVVFSIRREINTLPFVIYYAGVNISMNPLTSPPRGMDYRYESPHPSYPRALCSGTENSPLSSPEPSPQFFDCLQKERAVLSLRQSRDAASEFTAGSC